ncbi:hypothetical protein [Listeria costaricensis]|uniref:hypothetical protein n=1 Tax=Listeria costaricensis TaxID=2026604 RepID=UPI000C088FB5|nr:hypothetical protein [Listeria costaricensis]
MSEVRFIPNREGETFKQTSFISEREFDATKDHLIEKINTVQNELEKLQRELKEAEKQKKVNSNNSITSIISGIAVIVAIIGIFV